MTRRFARRAADAGALMGMAFLLTMQVAQAGSIRFFGNGTNDIDRVKIRIDDPANNNPGPPADIGNGAFTIEFWIKGSSADNNNTVRCGAGVYGWIDGDIVIDRDRFNQNRSWGLALGGGRVAFGASDASGSIATLCGSVSVLDGQWHHVAVTRAGGTFSIFIDGVLDQSGAGPSGDLSYPDNGAPGNFCGGPCTNSDPFIVIGAEKHDAVPGQLAFNGFIDEVRLSSVARYSGNFTRPATPFADDGNTAGLYHFDEATAGNCASGTMIADAHGNQSPGACRFGGSPQGPVWSTDTPFTGGGGGGAGTLQFSASTASVAESAGTVGLNVTRSGGTSGSASVSYASANGSALAGSDYTTASGTLNWADNDGATKPIAIPILEDTDQEGNHSFTVTLSGATGAALGSPSLATVTINDNDAPGTVQLSAATFTVAEGSPTQAVTVTRTNGSAGAITVNFQTSDGTAMAPGDYTSASGNLSWAAGNTTAQTVTIPIGNDSLIEQSETLTFSLSSPSGGAALGTPNSATITITDNDSAGSLQLSAATYTVAESAGTQTITVSRTGGSLNPVSVNYATAAGTAAAGADFTNASGTLSWADGESGAKTFAVTIADDATQESSETLTVALSGATGGAVIGAPASASVTITDNDGSSSGGGGGGGGGGSLNLTFLLVGLLLLAWKSDAFHFRRAIGILRPRL